MSKIKNVKPFLFLLTTVKENLLSAETDSERDGKFAKRANVQFAHSNRTFIIYSFVLYFLSLLSTSANRVLYQTVQIIIKLIKPARSRQLHICGHYRLLSILRKGNTIALYFVVSFTWITLLRSEIRFYFKVESVDIYYSAFSSHLCYFNRNRIEEKKTRQKTSR